MKKNNVEINSKKVNFNCVACNSSYELDSTLQVDNYTIDVCSNCHPFYLGTTATGQMKGRAEKLMSKFNTGKSLAKSKK